MPVLRFLVLCGVELLPGVRVDTTSPSPTRPPPLPTGRSSLDLAYNDLTGTIPDAVSALKYLRYVPANTHTQLFLCTTGSRVPTGSHVVYSIPLSWLLCTLQAPVLGVKPSLWRHWCDIYPQAA